MCAVFDGPIVATHESMAGADYRDIPVAGTLDGVLLASAFTGLPTNMLRPARRLKGPVQTTKGCHIVESIPRTTLGKIDKKLLRQRFQ